MLVYSLFSVFCFVLFENFRYFLWVLNYFLFVLYLFRQLVLRFTKNKWKQVHTQPRYVCTFNIVYCSQLGYLQDLFIYLLRYIFIQKQIQKLCISMHFIFPQTQWNITLCPPLSPSISLCLSFVLCLLSLPLFISPSLSFTLPFSLPLFIKIYKQSSTFRS